MRRAIASAVRRAWAGDGAIAAALAPLGWLYGGAMAARNAAYRRGLRRVTAPLVPTVSIGNLTVGGTGKTPVSAWFADALAARGARPGVVLRGYGDDEPLVHRTLVPSAVVVADPDRVRGSARAVAEGAVVVVLDDAFQHRRAGRTADVVLLAAEQGWPRRCLPAGPLREPWAGLRRADLLLVTRKTADAATAAAFARRLAAAFDRPVAVVELAAGGLRAAAGRPADAPPPGSSVLAVSGIGEPAAFLGQLASSGWSVVPATYPDHHAYTEADVTELATRGAEVDAVVCTLKDAVKLAPRWPAGAPPLWYLSQVVRIDSGRAHLDGLLDRLHPFPHV